MIADGSEGVGPTRINSDKNDNCILLVDDDPVVNEVISEIVRALGFDVLTALDGCEAIATLQNSQRKISCVVLDFDIPDMHCSQLLKRLRAFDNSLPILLSSGFPQASVDAAIKLHSVDGFIPKPYNPSHLVNELHRLLAGPAGPAA